MMFCSIHFKRWLTLPASERDTYASGFQDLQRCHMQRLVSHATEFTSKHNLNISRTTTEKTMLAGIDDEKSCCRTKPCETIKLVLGTLVVMTLVLVVFVGVSLSYCVLQIFPLVNFILMFGALTLLAYCEALHYSVVSIEKWDMTQYKEKFPRAVKCHALVNTPQKVKQFLVGRQFFVIFVVFLLAQITSFPGIPSNFAGMPYVLVLILVQTGLPGVALTLTFGQLVSQIYVEEFTLQFMNLYGCEFVIRLSLGAEWIGVCNFSWLLFGIVSRLFFHKVRRIQKELNRTKSTDNILGNAESQSVSNNNANVEPMSPTEMNRGPDYVSGLEPEEKLSWFDYFKYIWSTCATIGAMVVVCYGISLQVYVLPTPPIGGYIIAIVALTILFYLEGMMIAIVGTQYWDPETFKDIYPRAYQIHKFINKPDNVKRFIIGRQFFTVLTNFLLAQVFTFHHWKAGSINPVIFYIAIQSGLVGVLIILSCAQLLPELMAAEYPLRFMDMYGSYSIAYMSLVFDAIGVGHCAWTVYFVTRKLCCKGQMQDDKVATDTKPTILRIQSAEILAASDTDGSGNNKPGRFF